MKKTLLGLSIIAALSPAVASAEDFYVGVSVGATETDALDIFKVPGISVDDDDTGFKVFAGYRAHEYFAVEAFYADLGEATASDVVDSLEIESDTFGLKRIHCIREGLTQQNNPSLLQDSSTNYMDLSGFLEFPLYKEKYDEGDNEV